MIVTKKMGTILNNDRKLLALFGGMVFDGIVFISLMIAIAILYFL
ncbi:MAG: hypothetical protein NT082_07595 [Chloroflexi bacterium]|nr:hypothetical protein [Chloroflexota bacterium]